MKEEDRRPDSEQLLRSIQNADGPPGGRLKIFFGYAAGVGKTYAMLEAAHRAKEAGVDVVAGYIEPHTRPETMALLEGLGQTRSLIAQAYAGFNAAKDPDLIESYVFEINALQARYSYLLRRVKELDGEAQAQPG